MEFRRVLFRSRRNTIGVAVGCTLAGMAIVVLWTAPPTTVRLEGGAASSIPGLAPRLADSVACGLARGRSEEHTSELQSPFNLVFRLLLVKKKKKNDTI